MLTGKVWTWEAAEKELDDLKETHFENRQRRLLERRLAVAKWGAMSSQASAEQERLDKSESDYKAHTKALLAVITLLEVEAKEGSSSDGK
jgi:hypothetical protein